VAVVLIDDAIGRNSVCARATGVAVVENRGPYSLRGEAVVSTSISLPDFSNMASLRQLFSEVAAVERSNAILAHGTWVRPTSRVKATLDWLSMFGVDPVIGRTFADDDYVPSATPVALLSESIFAREFTGDRSVIGREVVLDGTSHTVVGVVADWVSTAVDKREAIISGESGSRFILTPLRLEDPAYALATTRRDIPKLKRVLVRLRGGVSVEKAGKELATLGSRLAIEHPSTNRGRSFSIATFSSWYLGDVIWLLAALTVAAGAVFAMSCWSAMMLMVADGVKRRTDLAVRMACGASRARVVRREMLSALVLVSPAIGIAYVFAASAIAIVAAATGSSLFSPASELRGPMVLFVTGIAVGAACVLASGGAAAAVTRRWGPEALRGDAGQLPPGQLWARACATAQLSCATALVCVAALLLVSMWNVLSVDLGFNVQRALVIEVQLPARQFPDGEAQRRFCERALARIVATPGVEAAGLSVGAPLTGASMLLTGLTVESATGERKQLGVVRAESVTSGYFAALGLRIVQGRGFSSGANQDGIRPAVVDERFASRHLGEAGPLGATLWYGEMRLSVVGVVRNTHTGGPTQGPQETLYLPESYDRPIALRHVIIRTDGELRNVGSRIVEDLRSQWNQACIGDPQAMTMLLASRLATRSHVLWLIGGCAVILTALTMITVAAMVAQLLASQERMFALRIALGARPRDIGLVVCRFAGWVLVLGLTTGSGAGIAVARMISGHLFGLGPTDPATILVAVALVLAACMLPSAILMARIDFNQPWRALRAE